MKTEEIPVAYRNKDKLRDAYERGYSHGHGFACNNVPAIGDSISRCVDYVGLGKTVDAENIREYHELLCFAAESSSRDYSPFEFTAHEFNSADLEAEMNGGPGSEELWEAYDEGIADAIRSDLATYTDEDYGIPSWGNPPKGFEDYQLPAYWASYLINGDASGLEDGEQDQIDEWFANEKGIGGCVGCSDESEFKYRNDATNLGGDVLWYRFPIIAATGC